MTLPSVAFPTLIYADIVAGVPGRLVLAAVVLRARIWERAGSWRISEKWSSLRRPMANQGFRHEIWTYL